MFKASTNQIAKEFEIFKHSHSIYFNDSQYSAEYPILSPTQNLKCLNIDYALMHNIVTLQKQQNVHKLRYVMGVNWKDIFDAFRFITFITV